MGSLYFKEGGKIIALVKSQLKPNSNKKGIEVPRDLAHTEKINTENEHRFWQDSHDKEMFNVSVAFEILENGKSAPVGMDKDYQTLNMGP